MKKISLLTALLLVVAVAAWSQAGQTTGPGSTSGTTTPTTGPGASTTPDQSATADHRDHGKKGGEKTLEGCVVERDNSFFIQPRRGGLVRLNATGGEDLKAHVGHEVKIRGTMARSSETTTGTAAPDKSPGGTSATATSSGSTTGSGTAANVPGVAGQTSKPEGPEAAATAGTETGKAESGRVLTISRIDMVSETCSITGKSETKSDTTKKPY